jgi:hypothetical protein
MKKIIFAALVCATLSSVDCYAQQTKPVTGNFTKETSGGDRTSIEYYAMFKELAGNKSTVDPLCANNGYDVLITKLKAMLLTASPAMKGQIGKAIADAVAAQRKCPGYHPATAQNISYQYKTIQSDAAGFSTQSAL